MQLAYVHIDSFLSPVWNKNVRVKSGLLRHFRIPFMTKSRSISQEARDVTHEQTLDDKTTKNPLDLKTRITSKSRCFVPLLLNYPI